MAREQKLRALVSDLSCWPMLRGPPAGQQPRGVLVASPFATSRSSQEAWNWLRPTRCPRLPVTESAAWQFSPGARRSGAAELCLPSRRHLCHCLNVDGVRRSFKLRCCSQLFTASVAVQPRFAASLQSSVTYGSLYRIQLSLPLRLPATSFVRTWTSYVSQWGLGHLAVYSNRPPWRNPSNFALMLASLCICPGNLRVDPPLVRKIALLGAPFKRGALVGLTPPKAWVGAL